MNKRCGESRFEGPRIDRDWTIESELRIDYESKAAWLQIAMKGTYIYSHSVELPGTSLIVDLSTEGQLIGIEFLDLRALPSGYVVDQEDEAPVQLQQDEHLMCGPWACPDCEHTGNGQQEFCPACQELPRLVRVHGHPKRCCCQRPPNDNPVKDQIRGISECCPVHNWLNPASPAPGCGVERRTVWCGRR